MSRAGAPSWKSARQRSRENRTHRDKSKMQGRPRLGQYTNIQARTRPHWAHIQTIKPANGMTIESEQNEENPQTLDLGGGESPAKTVFDDVFGRGLPIVAALNLLRIRLLDLTKNNRLLNFKHTAGKSLQFIESSPEAVYRKLVENSTAKLKLVPVPEPARDEWAERNGRMARPDVVEYAKLRGIDVSLELSSQSEESPSALQTLLYPEDLERHARKLAGEGQSAIEETGANMLYLVFGFIEYPEHEGSDKNLIAPLISMPAALERGEREDSSGHYRYYLKASGEDVTENLSLRERLKQDFSLNLPDWNEELTPNLYFAAIEELIRNKPGWRLRRQLTVGLLSFSKMLLFRDLDPDNWPQDSTGLSKLLDHSVVRLMIEGREGGERNEIAVLGGPPEYAIDEHKERVNQGNGPYQSSPGYNQQKFQRTFDHYFLLLHVCGQ